VPPVDSRLPQFVDPCIVRAVKALWHRRAVRHVVIGLLPLLVVGPVLVVVLAVRLADTAAPLRDATVRATGTVQRAGGGADGRELEVRWTDETGATRTSTVRAAGAGDVPVGARVELRHRPGDPDRVFVTGDETSAEVSSLTSSIALVVLVTGAAAAATAVHLGRRRAAERRDPRSLPVSYARSRFGISRRSWLLVREDGRDWWVSVHWEPVLETLGPKARADVRGRPARDRVLAFDVAGTTVWQAGRHRPGPPRGEIDRETQAADAPPATLGRQFRADAGVRAAAPVLGLIWAYVDGGGWVSWLLASLLSATVLFWVPTMVGSDPR
jgi:hypothetical protein